MIQLDNLWREIQCLEVGGIARHIHAAFLGAVLVPLSRWRGPNTIHTGMSPEKYCLPTHQLRTAVMLRKMDTHL